MKRSAILMIIINVFAVVTIGAKSLATEARVGEQQAPRQAPATAYLNKEVRHELVMLPYYDVFDDLSFRVDGSTVTLMGHASRPTLKSDAENVVKNIEGVERVVNEIKVTPVSPNDDRIRMAVYRAIYGQTGLQRYGLQAVPPIHIIVNNGNVALEGVVATEADKNPANFWTSLPQGWTRSRKS
jgi:hyperosmotically inducible protein